MKKKTVVYLIGGLFAILFIAFFIQLVSRKPQVTLTVDSQITKPVSLETDPIYGPADAANTIYLFGYVGCEQCADMTSSLRSIVDRRSDLNLVWKDFPNTTIAPTSLSASIAGRCAEEQDAFWDYLPYLFANVEKLDRDYYIAIAKDVGIKEKKFSKCFDNAATAPIVQAAIDEGTALQIGAVPTIFIGNERYSGKQTPAELDRIINDAL